VSCGPPYPAASSIDRPSNRRIWRGASRSHTQAANATAIPALNQVQQIVRWHDVAAGRKVLLVELAVLSGDHAAPREGTRWTPRGIQVELKEETRKRLGRSPDRGDAVVLAMEGAVRWAAVKRTAYDRAPRGPYG